MIHFTIWPIVLLGAAWFSPRVWAEPPDPVQITRFQPSLAAIEAASRSESGVLRGMLEADVRYHFFSLQALLRIYESKYPALEGLRDEVKETEDRLGETADKEKRVAFGKEIGLPSEAIEYLERRARESFQETEKWMKDKGWTGLDAKNPLKELEAKLHTVRWNSYEEDRKLIRKEMIGEIDTITSAHYELSKLQEGVHQLRKDLRKILTSMQALRSVIYEDTKSILDSEKYLADPNASKKYTDLDVSPLEKDPVKMPRDALAALASIVRRFGHIKDIGEAQFEWLPEALFEAKVVKTKAGAKRSAAARVKKHHHYREIFGEARQLFAEMNRLDLLKVIRDRCGFERLAK